MSALTSTLNCRSRKARLRGAAGSADTSCLAVASDVPFQASAGMPPVCTVRKPVGLSSKFGAWAKSGDTRTRPSTPAAKKLARKAIIGDWYLEMTQWRSRLDDGESHEAGNQQADDDHDDHRPNLKGGHGESMSGTEHGHGAGNLPGRRQSGNCRRPLP